MKAEEPAVPYLVQPVPRMFNMHDAKSNLSRLVDEAASGREVIIAKAGKPAARLVALEYGRHPIRLGVAAGRFEIPDDFDEPLPADIWANTLEGMDKP